MQYGLSLPPFGGFSDPHVLLDAARRAEAAGWDGFFIWDHLRWRPPYHPILDPWVMLGAIATATTRVKIGTMITPLARRRPWKVAKETMTLDRLSNGRLILGIGLGDPVPDDFAAFHDETDAKIRAQKLDEGLAILNGLWTGEPFSFQGQHYQLDEMTFQPTPVQTPRPPIWIAGVYGNKPPMRRAAHWDGFFPIKFGGPITPDEVREALSYIGEHRPDDQPLDLILDRPLPDDPAQARDLLHQYDEAGMTWWMAPLDPWAYGAPLDKPWQPDYTQMLLDRIDRGPAKI